MARHSLIRRLEELEAAAQDEDAGGAFVVDLGDEDDLAVLDFQRRYPEARTVDIGGADELA